MIIALIVIAASSFAVAVAHAAVAWWRGRREKKAAAAAAADGDGAAGPLDPDARLAAVIKASRELQEQLDALKPLHEELKERRRLADRFSGAPASEAGSPRTGSGMFGTRKSSGVRVRGERRMLFVSLGMRKEGGSSRVRKLSPNCPPRALADSNDHYAVARSAGRGPSLRNVHEQAEMIARPLLPRHEWSWRRRVVCLDRQPGTLFFRPVGCPAGPFPFNACGGAGTSTDEEKL